MTASTVATEQAAEADSAELLSQHADSMPVAPSPSTRPRLQTSPAMQLPPNPAAARPLLSVAPMMDWTDVHFRQLARLVSRRVWLWTEMVVDKTVIHTPNLDKHLWFPPEQRPLVLQLGGSDPALLAAAAAKAAAYGYDEINLNCGCPSDRVAGAGCFGAALMMQPGLVADCMTAMAEALAAEAAAAEAEAAAATAGAEAAEAAEAAATATAATVTAGGAEAEAAGAAAETATAGAAAGAEAAGAAGAAAANGSRVGVTPVNVKCRLGVDECDSYAQLHEFVKVVSERSPVTHFIVHSRKAFLNA